MKERIGIIGGGVVGLAIAWQCARAGMDVTLYDRGNIGEGTSSVAAGMLAPEAEVNFGEEALMKLGQKSLSMYPDFLAELEEDLGDAPQLDRCGTVLVGKDRDDSEHLRRLYEFRRELGLQVEWWGGSFAREKLDLLSPRIGSAVWLPEDAQIENRDLLQGLAKAARSKGGHLREGCEVKGYEKVEGGEGFRLWTEEGEAFFQELVVAAGAWSDRIGEGVPSLHPVKGQILTLGGVEGGGPDRMIRSPRVYIVPKADGTVRVGGTSEEVGFDTMPTAGGVRELLEEAWELLPALQDAPFISVDVGLRPAHTDHRPSVGRNEEGLIHATGHYRHGFLLAPITAYAVREILLEGGLSEPLWGREEG